MVINIRDEAKGWFHIGVLYAAQKMLKHDFFRYEAANPINKQSAVLYL